MDLRDEHIQWLAKTGTELQSQEAMIASIYQWRGQQFTAAAQVVGGGSITVIVGAIAAYLNLRTDPLGLALATLLGFVACLGVLATFIFAYRAT